MAIHGHTTIELTDVNTGNVEKYEDDNIVTDAIKDWLAGVSGGLDLYTQVAIGTSTSRVSQCAYHPKRIFGGLFCFQNKVDEDAENYGFPSDNVLIAHGTAKSYSGDDTTMGNYSNLESNILENGVTFVWNFSESQGNGEISAVCLTNPIGGLMGYGNEGSSYAYSEVSGSENYYGMKNFYLYAEKYPTFGMLDVYSAYRSSDNENRQYIGQYAALHNINGVYYADGENECVYVLARGAYAFAKSASHSFDEFVGDCKYIRFSKFRMPSDNFYLLDIRIYKYLGDVYVNLPDELTADWSETVDSIYGSHWSSGRHMYIVMARTNNSYVEIDGTFKILKISVDDFNAEVITITNNVGERLQYPATVSNMGGGYNATGYSYRSFVGVGDYIFVVGSTTNKLYAINMITNYVTEIGVLSTGQIQLYVVDDNTIGVHTKGTNYMINVNDMIPRRLSNAYGRPMLDADLGISYNGSLAVPVWYKNKRVKSYFMTGVSPAFMEAMCSDTSYDNLHDFLANRSDTTYDNCITRVVPAVRNLLTINNLSSPVQKTPDKTMKITYTLYADDSV